MQSGYAPENLIQSPPPAQGRPPRRRRRPQAAKRPFLLKARTQHGAQAETHERRQARWLAAVTRRKAPPPPTGKAPSGRRSASAPTATHHPHYTADPPTRMGGVPAKPDAGRERSDRGGQTKRAPSGSYSSHRTSGAAATAYTAERTVTHRAHVPGRPRQGAGAIAPGDAAAAYAAPPRRSR